MFLLRKLMFPILLAAALFFGGSIVVESFAESQLANGMRTTLNLKTRPSVQISAFPIFLRIIQGRIPEVLVSARAVTIEGLEIEELSMDMRGVEASLDVLIRTNKFDLTVERGAGVARVSEEAVNAFLKREKVDAVVTLRADGTVVVRADEVIAGRRRRFEATGTLVLGGRTLTFKRTRVTVDGQPPPAALAARARRETAVSVEIPKLPAGIVPNEVTVAQGELALRATLDDYVLRVR